MQYSRTKKIIVDEYDQLCNSGVFRAFKQQYTRCQMCQQEIPLKLIISHKNVCEVESKQEESNQQPYEKYNGSIPENYQNKSMRNQKVKSSKKKGPTRPASMRNQYDSTYNGCTVKLSPRKRCFDSIGSDKKYKASNTRKYSHQKNEPNISKANKKQFNNPLNCSIKIKERVEKNEANQMMKKHREVTRKNIIGTRNDSKLLRQSIDSKITKPKENPYMKNSAIKDEERSKVKKKKINRSMISEGYNEYYQQVHPQLKKTNTSKKPNHKSRSKQKITGSKKKTTQYQRESTDPEHYYDDQKGKIKAIEKQRERLRKKKEKILLEIEQEKKRKEQEQERNRQQERERRRQRQREHERNRTSRNNQGNRRNRNRIFRSRRQQRQTQFFTEQSIFEQDNVPHENAFNFISETMNAQFEMMKEQFNQMNQIFSNFRPFNQNQFVFFERNSDSSYFSDTQSDQDLQFDQDINDEEEEEQGLTPDQIQTLNSFIYQRRLGIDDQCTVCLNSIKNSQQVRRLPCTHIFHINCIDQWLQKKTSCPICRQDILNSLN